ncbi:MAG: hypothetical protein BWX66_01573 [Deltaproteobacteria bacterium ADurb.Bin058]|jgi:hypothetical protein|nr:MAG: hypothetical protein BWX66_01573 [Deltaproteobacteria bacterium ADurb.Bin058]
MNTDNPGIILFRDPGQNTGLFDKLLQPKFKAILVVNRAWQDANPIATSHSIRTRHVLLYSHTKAKVFINRKVSDAKSTSAKNTPDAIFSIKQGTGGKAKDRIFNRPPTSPGVTSAFTTLKAAMKAVLGIRHKSGTSDKGTASNQKLAPPRLIHAGDCAPMLMVLSIWQKLTLQTLSRSL